MNDEDLATRVITSVKTWSQAMYGTIHALRLMRAVDLGNLKKLGFSMQESMEWIESRTGFRSAVPERNLDPASFDLEGEDEGAVFVRLAASVASMLVVSLTSLLDECLAAVLSAQGFHPDEVAGGKLNQVRSHLTIEALREYEWALLGARELVTLRNVIVHSGGIWNERCIKDLPEGDEKPAVGDVLAVGFGDVLRYKRAVRTLLNEALKILPRASA